MSIHDNDPYIEPEAEERNSVRDMRERIKQLEAEVQAKAELEGRLAVMERNEVIRSAGLDLNDLRRKALEASHTGEWTPEAVAKTAVELGFAAPPEPEVPPAEVAVHRQLQDAYSGASTTLPDRDAEIDAQLGQARNEAEFMAAYRTSGRPIVE